MTYTEITQQSFESVLSELGKWEQTKDPVAKENIYILDNNIKIYSSIVNGVSRDCGNDAIRVLGWCPISNLPVKSSEARVYRIDTWAKNLKERILKVKADIHVMKKCKTCGAFLTERENSTTHQKFWGCLNYKNHSKPKTINNKTVDNSMSLSVHEGFTTTIKKDVCIGDKKDADILTTIKSVFEPNKYQKDIFKFIQEGTGHAVIKAGAGCAKTTSIVMGTKYIPPNQKVLFLAFNKHIAIELQKKVSNNADVKTFHSLGLSAIMNAFGKVEVDVGKQRNILWEIVEKDASIKKDDKYDIVSSANKLCSLIKANLVDVTEDTILDLIDYHNIELPINITEMTWMVKLAIDLSLKQKKIVDYDDMIYFPLIFNLPCRQYDFVLIDELQDNNKAQTELSLRSVKPNGRIIGVGDENQALYGFRGSDTTAIPSIIKRLNATILPLSVTYRCPASHVRLANKLLTKLKTNFEISYEILHKDINTTKGDNDCLSFNNISSLSHKSKNNNELEARPNAPEGTIKCIDYADFFDIVKPGDMVICRNNAPLVRPAFELLGRGIKVAIKGRDIGENLVNIIKKFKTSNIDTFFEMLNEWKKVELDKCARRGTSPDMVNDKYEVLNILSDGCKDVQCIVNKIKTIFSDENTVIVFSSVHRAKGLEADTVHILEPSLMPSRRATQPWQIEEEIHIQYVAVTRSKDKLYIVSANGDETIFPEYEMKI